jgi:hypothetical protein
MDFQGLKVGDFAYFERLTASIKVLGRECLRDVKPRGHQNKIHTVQFTIVSCKNRLVEPI